jgi:hypothetical protein
VAFVTLNKCAFLFAAYTFSVLTLISGGCYRQGTAQQSEVQRELETRFNQLELKIGAAKAEWRQNELIVVNVYLINNGKGHVIVTDSGVWAGYQISLVDGNNRPVSKKDVSLKERANRGAVSTSFQTRAIEPGETVEDRIPLNEDFEMNRKGLYKLAVQLHVGIRGIAERKLISNTMTISVVE